MRGDASRVAAAAAMLMGGLAGVGGPAWADDALTARNLAASCANCHGTGGRALGDIQPLAGQSAEKIIAAVADFRSGDQPATVMQQIAKGYTEAQIRLIAGYFAALPAAK